MTKEFTLLALAADGTHYIYWNPATDMCEVGPAPDPAMSTGHRWCVGVATIKNPFNVRADTKASAVAKHAPERLRGRWGRS